MSRPVICMLFRYVSSLCLAAKGFRSPRSSPVNTDAKKSLRMFKEGKGEACVEGRERARKKEDKGLIKAEIREGNSLLRAFHSRGYMSEKQHHLK